MPLDTLASDFIYFRRKEEPIKQFPSTAFEKKQEKEEPS